MPLLWKTRFKKQNKSKAPQAVNGGPHIQEVKSDKEVIQKGGGGGRERWRRREERVENGGLEAVKFIMITEDFDATESDELTVHRGQIVQLLYNNNGALYYIKDVNNRYGYIPANICCPVDKMHDTKWQDTRNGIVSIPKSTPEPKINYTEPFPYNSLSSNSTLSSKKTSPQIPRHTETPFSNGEPQNVPVRKVSEISGIIDLSASPQVARYSLEHMLHPLHPLSISQYRTSSSSHGRSIPSEQDTLPPSTPAVQPLLVHLRRDSYQEAITKINDGQSKGDTQRLSAPKIKIHHPSRPLNLPIQPDYDHLEDFQNDTLGTGYTSNSGGRTFESSQNSNLVDDVFLPSSQKPIGIYRAISKYNRTVQGEVSLGENEYVIVTEIGRSEWAWVITASGSEGLVPKNVLSRYSPSQGTVSAGTQTELIVMGSVHMQSTPSSGSSQQERNVVCIREIPHIPPRALSSRRQVSEMAVQTELRMSPPPIDGAWGNSQLDDLWYENSMSIPQLPGTGCDFHETSIRTLPELNEYRQARGKSPLAFHSSRQSLPQIPGVVRNGITPLNWSMSIRNGPTTPMGLHTRALKDQRDWPISPGVFSNYSETSTGVKPSMTVLTCIKDFSPGNDNSSCLSLKKGDILHLFPGSNNNKDWLWAYHVRQHCHGYVPKTHITDVYITNNRQHTNFTMCDEV